MHDDDITPPNRIPESDFYYHYKHDPEGSEENYAYEVVGVGHHTEEERTFFVVYRPLYESALVYRLGRMYDIRPLEMFMEAVVKDGTEKPRFTPITDLALLERLKQQRDRMYS